MLSNEISKRKINLKKELQKIVESDPIIKERFKNATLVDTVDGYGLPLGSKKRIRYELDKKTYNSFLFFPNSLIGF